MLDVRGGIVGANSSIDLAAGIIKEFEGLSLAPYLCPAGLPTVGYGHVIREGEAHLRAGVTVEQAAQILAVDLAWAFREVHNVRDDLMPHQAAALASLIFNIGPGAWRKSTIKAKIMVRDWGAAAREFERWNKSGGVVLAGLVRRRKAERLMFEGK